MGNVILYWNYFGLLTRVWLLLQGWAGIFVTSSCSICHLWMRVTRVLGWRPTPFLFISPMELFGIFDYFSDLTISLPSERESRLVYLERSGRPPFFHIHTRAGKQAGRRVYQPSVFVTTNVCVCELHNNSIRRRNDETPSALISILFFIIYLSPLIESWINSCVYSALNLFANSFCV